MQIGAEIFGHAGVESDIEILRLMWQTLGLAGVRDIYLDLGHVGIFRGLARQANLTPEQETELFEAERRHLVGVAYRLLGTMTDAEDVLQDVFERWLRLQGGAGSARPAEPVANPAAYLTTMTTRASIDRLRSARTRREVYVGPWLPEPVPTTSDDAILGPPGRPRAIGRPGQPSSPEAVAELDESLTIGYLYLLEQLTPHERAAHLLHDVYDFSYREIAPMIDRSEANCRQLASRARSKLRASRPDRDRATIATVDLDDELCQRLVGAVAAGDVGQVMAVLADDVVHLSDGGADHRAARKPVLGRDRVARLLANLAGRLSEAELAEISASLRDFFGWELKEDGKGVRHPVRGVRREGYCARFVFGLALGGAQPKNKHSQRPWCAHKTERPRTLPSSFNSQPKESRSEVLIRPNSVDRASMSRVRNEQAREGGPLPSPCLKRSVYR